MNYCTSCGSQLKENAAFCSSCGTKVEGASTQIPGENNTETNSASTDEMKEKISTTFSNAKTTIEKSSYFNFLKTTAKNPSGNTIAEGNNGWLHLIVLSVMTVISLYTMLNATIKISLNEFGLGAFSVRATGFLNEFMSSIFPRALFASIILYGAFILVAYGTMKIGNKMNELTLSQMVNQYVSLLTPNIVILIGISILSTFLASEETLVISTFFLVFSVILCFVSFNYFIYHSVTINGLDKLYTLLVTNVLLLIVLTTMVYSQVEPVITMLENLENMVNMRW